MSNSPEIFGTVQFPTLTADPDIPQGLIDAAKERGYATGYAAGARRAEEDLAARLAQIEQERADEKAAVALALDTALNALNTAATHVAAQTVPALADAEDTLAAAAYDLAEAVLGRELSTGEDTAKDALARVLGHPEAGQILTVRLHPDDLAVVDGVAELVSRNITLIADPALDRGDAIAEMTAGLLDARLGEALQRARTSLAGD